MSVCFIPPNTTLLYSKTGVYRSIHYFLIFALKHRLWVLEAEAVLTCTNNLCFEQKYENSKKKSIENYFFQQSLYGRVFVMLFVW